MTTTQEQFPGESRYVIANGLRIHVHVAGEGPPVMLLHGWPFTSYIWRRVAPALVAAGYRVIAPDLRGIGGTDRPARGYDLEVLSEDAAQLLDALGEHSAHVVGFDLGTAIAWMLAMRHPHKVRQLAIMEGMIGKLPGAERFLVNGPPWWFGFHAIPGLAEKLLEGREAAYLGWFFSARGPHHHPIDPAAQQVYVEAYSGIEALRGGFEHYRAFTRNAEQVDAIAAGHRLLTPTLAISGGVVGEALHRQLLPLTNNLAHVSIADCGHNIPEEQPDALAKVLLDFFTR